MSAGRDCVVRRGDFIPLGAQVSTKALPLRAPSEKGRVNDAVYGERFVRPCYLAFVTHSLPHQDQLLRYTPGQVGNFTIFLLSLAVPSVYQHPLSSAKLIITLVMMANPR